VPAPDDGVDRAALLDAIAQDICAHLPCEFEICRSCTQLVPGEGDPDADVVLVGEAPGATEDLIGRPFVGAAGRLLDDLLEAAGLRRDDVFITNLVRARPPGNRDPRAAEIAHHRPWLEAELEIIAPRLVVPLGRHALMGFTRGATISAVHGRAIPASGHTLFPMFHPAAALRSTTLRRTAFRDARALGETLAAQATAPPGSR
jgi:DNA polymerase